MTLQHFLTQYPLLSDGVKGCYKGCCIDFPFSWRVWNSRHREVSIMDSFAGLSCEEIRLFFALCWITLAVGIIFKIFSLYSILYFNIRTRFDFCKKLCYHLWFHVPSFQFHYFDFILYSLWQYLSSHFHSDKWMIYLSWQLFYCHSLCFLCLERNCYKFI